MKAVSEQEVVPRARQSGLVVQELPDEVLVYDLERDRAHCLNRSAALVWQCCDGRRTLSEVARKLSRDLRTPVTTQFVRLALEQLSKFRLLETRVAQPHRMGRLSRREMMRTGVSAAALSLPLIVSIVAPTHVQAASCKPLGAVCAADSECCSTKCGTKVLICVTNPCRLGGSPCTQDTECCSGKCLNSGKCRN